MAVPITVQDVEQVLRPRLGAMFLSSNSFAQGLAHKLQEHAPYRQTLEELREEVESYVVTKLSRFTGSTMQIVKDDFRTIRLTLQDIRLITDDAMGVLFDHLTPFSINFEKLNDYALRVESLAALRVLYQKYASFFSEEEYRFLVQTIRDLYSPIHYKAWLPEDAGR